MATAQSAAALASGSHTQPDLMALKTKQHAAWSSGDYAVVGTTLQIVGAGAKSPALWGVQSRISDMFGGEANYYGPLLKAFAARDEPNQRALAHDLVTLIGRVNSAADGAMIVSSEYLEVVIIKR